MFRTILTKSALALSGIVALGVGAALLIDPRGFLASTGITLDRDATLLSELRSPAGLLIACGLFALSGLLRTGLAVPALVASAAIYLSFGLSRLAGMALDGVPHPAMVQTLALELAVGAICLLALAIRDRGASAIPA